MKITYLLGSLDRGGTETLLLDVFKNASKNNLSANCFYRKSGELENSFLNSGLEILKLPVGKNIIAYLFKLRQHLIKNNTTIVHAQQPIDAFLAYFACLGTNINILLSLHGYDFNETKVSKLILKYIIKRSDLNIYVSDTQKTYYVNKYSLKRESQKVVYNGISFEKFDKAKSDLPNLRNELLLTPETILIASVGSFNEVRDQLTLCRFANELKIKGLDFRLLLIGKRIESCSHYYDNCIDYCQKNNLEDNVVFTGVRNDVPQILNQVDCFVYATDHDTFGIAVVEAIATGLPVFVNDWEVMNEITNNGELVSLYKTGDEKDLVRKFMLFLQDKSNYKTKALKSVEIIRNTYNIETHINNLRNVYMSF